MDLALLHALQTYLACSALDAIMPAFSFLGEKGAIWLLISFALLVTRKYRVWGALVLVSVAGAWLIGDCLVKPIVARPRPFVEDPTIQLIVVPPSGCSFPSGHTSSSFAAATVIAFMPIGKR